MYTVKETAEMLHLNPHTVRYYAKMDLIPNLHRSEKGVRLFTDENIAYLKGVAYMRRCGMSISSIKEFFSLTMQGTTTITEQYKIILEQKQKLDTQIEKLYESKKYLDEKLKMYEQFLSDIEKNN